MREAIRRPTRDGVLDGWIQVFLSFQAYLLDSKVLGVWTSVLPLLKPPQETCAFRPAESKTGGLARLGASWAEKMAFQEAFKNWSNFDAISTSILERLGSVLEAQDRSKIDQKSIQIEFPRASVSVSFFTSILRRFLVPTSTPWISKKYVFPKEK